jgi:heme oxygenase
MLTRDANKTRREHPVGAASSSLFSDHIRAHTHALHVQAEKSGIIRDLLTGRATRYGYALLLRNLLLVYRLMERGLQYHARTPGIGRLARPQMYRSAALKSDLGNVYGRTWRSALPLLPAGKRYARRIAEVSAGDGVALVGHVYTRYFGDLSGGQILGRILSRSLKLDDGSLAFYAFSGIADTDAFKEVLRGDVDAIAMSISNPELIAEAAAEAFRLNIALAIEVQETARARDAVNTPQSVDWRKLENVG